MASVMGVLASDDSPPGILFSATENSSFEAAPSIPPHIYFFHSEISAWQTEFRLPEFCFIFGCFVYTTNGDLSKVNPQNCGVKFCVC